MQKQINVIFSERYVNNDPYGPGKRKKVTPKLKLAYLPKDNHPILTVNDIVANEIKQIGLLSFCEVPAYWIKKLVREGYVTCPFYVFHEVIQEIYTAKYLLVPKLVYDLRNVPRFTYVLRGIEGKDSIIVK